MTQGKIIAFYSGKGGTGKSVVAANMACALALIDRKTVVLDIDRNLRCQVVLLGMESQAMFSIMDVIKRSCSLKEAIISDKRQGKVFLLTVPGRGETWRMEPGDLGLIIGELRQQYDYILIDSPENMDTAGFLAAIPQLNSVLVTNPEPLAIRGADRMAGIIEDLGEQSPLLIVNRWHPELSDLGKCPEIPEILDALSLKLLGIIPEEPDMAVAASQGRPVVLDKDSRSGQAFMDIADRLEGEDVPMSTYSKSVGLIDKIRNFWM